jgi:flagellar hook-associated protein 2
MGIMVDSVNTSRLVVGSDGRTSFSGLGGGIDFQAAVDSMVEAKRVPINKIQDTIKTNEKKITSLNDLNTRLTAVRESLDKLRGKISADRSSNIFFNKQSFQTTSRETSLLNNPTRIAASSASNLAGVSVTGRTEKGSYDLEILRTAKAQKDSSAVLSSRAQQDRSDAITSDSTGLDVLVSMTGGSFTINSKTVTVLATDTLQQVRDKINAVADIGVTASITNPGAGDYRLVITNNTAGSATSYSDSSDILAALGVLNNDDTIKNQVQAAVTNTNSALNAVVPGFLGGSFIINGKTISIDATNTLQDLRDRINNADAKISASIVTSSTTDAYLVLTANDTGTPIVYSDTSNVLAALGVLNNDDSVKNQLQASQTSQFTANGLRDASRQRSDMIYNPAVNLVTLAPGLVTTGAQSFQITSGVTNFTVNYNDTMTTNGLISAINSAASLAGSDVTASLETIEGGNGGFRLIIKDASGDAVSFSADTGGVVAAMDFRDPKILERASNTVSDLIDGMTINLFAAEGGTTIKIDVEQNLNDVKAQMVSFVDSYNALIEYMNKQTKVDPITGKPTEDTGILFGSRVISDVTGRLGLALSQSVAGVNTAFAALGNIGIKFVDNNKISNQDLRNTLEIDEQKLDQVLLNNGEEVRKLFTFDGRTNDSRWTITGFEGDVQYATGGLDINFTHDGTKITAADIGGNSSLIEIIGDNSIKIKDGPGKGMTLFYNGGTAAGTVNAAYTVGFAANMFNEIQDLLTLDRGTVDSEVDALTTTNKTDQERIDRMNERIETFRQMQLEKFTRMDAAMSSARNILNQLQQTTAAQNRQN